MKKRVILKWLAKAFLFLFISFFAAAIFNVARSFVNPDFTGGFLLGKQALFNDYWFPAALYVHAFSAPIALVIVSLLVLFRLEKRIRMHRLLGKTALILIFLAVIPSGWILSYFAMGGSAGKFVFFLLTSYTAYAAFRGYDAIRKKETTSHRRWMLEILALLASAILLRLLLALFQLQFSWFGDTAYVTAAILSWIPSICVLKITAYVAQKRLINT